MALRGVPGECPARRRRRARTAPTGAQSFRVISKIRMAWMIQAEDVRKTYRIGKVDVPALRGVSLQVEKGEFVTIVGPVRQRQIDACSTFWAG